MNRLSSKVEFITRDGCITEIRITSSEPPTHHFADFTAIERSKFRIFLFHSFPDLQEPQLAALSNVCLDAHHSEFFLCFNITDQWVRMVVGHDEKLCPNAWIVANDRCKLISDSRMLRAAIRNKATLKVIYNFGEPCDRERVSYFLKYIPRNLFDIIVDMDNCGVAPPFKLHVKPVIVLLQFAEAIRYMHLENMVHCKLKSQNILISKVSTYYLVKVADCRNARPGHSSSFIAGKGTTSHCAPEGLEQLKDKLLLITEPHKIDIYSFSIVAFEVLTRNDICIDRHREYKSGVIDGSVRPLLRTECRKDVNLIQNENLISLIESCWHKDACQRPTFMEFCDTVMKEIRNSV